MDNITEQQYKDYHQFFNEHRYVLVKNVIAQDVASFLFNYGVIRHNRAKHFQETKWPYHRIDDGFFADKQVPNTYSCYGDPAMETLLAWVLGAMQKITGKTLVAQYSYWRLYKK